MRNLAVRWGSQLCDEMQCVARGVQWKCDEMQCEAIALRWGGQAAQFGWKVVMGGPRVLQWHAIRKNGLRLAVKLEGVCDGMAVQAPIACTESTGCVHPKRTEMTLPIEWHAAPSYTWGGQTVEHLDEAGLVGRATSNADVVTTARLDAYRRRLAPL